MKDLTARQREIYSWIVKFVEDHLHIPSLHQIGRQFGIRNHNAVGEHLQRLDSKGIIEYRSPAPGAPKRIKFLKIRFRAVRVRSTHQVAT